MNLEKYKKNFKALYSCDLEEVEGAIDLRLSIDNDKAADWYGKRVRVTVEVDSE